MTALTKLGSLVNAVGYQGLVNDNPTLDFGNGVAKVFIDRRVEDAGVIGTHTWPKEVKRAKAVAYLVVVSGDEVRVVLSLAVFVASLPESQPMTHQKPTGFDGEGGGFAERIVRGQERHPGAVGNVPFGAPPALE